ncbi:MAG: M48 family metallopeptidase [Clostridiales bacterium]|nr:M48 family metallopeptidase [Clostridiales bacterium]
MVEPDLIVRSYRRSLCLSINKDGKLIVHAPKKLSLKEIYKYIEEKEKWIKTKQNEIQEKLKINVDVLSYKEFLFLGKKYKLVFLNGIKKIELGSSEIAIPNKIDKDQILQKIKQWYISNAKKILSERVEYFANLMQLDYASISLNNSKSKWGTCDSRRNIKLNFRLVMLPHKVIDYVIIHELSHIIEFNHSKNFYKIISTIMPSYKLQQKIIKEYDYVLRLFR